MGTLKEIMLLAFSLITIAMGFLSIKLLLNNLKFSSENEGKTKLSFGVWVTLLIVVYSINSTKTIEVLVETFDTMSKLNLDNQHLTLFQTSAIFIGLNIVWFIVWYYLSNLLSILLIGKRHALKELENDNISYFLVRGAILFGLILCFISIYESLLRIFIPTFNVPFYH